MHLRAFTPQFYDTTGALLLDQPSARLRSISMGGAARGGYKTARLRLSGAAVDLLRYYYMLGTWLTITAPDGYRCWDGIVYGLQFSNGLSFDLNDIFNAVDVVYSSSIGPRHNAGFTTDAMSVARYGRKELVQNTGGLTAATATAYRNLLLYFHLHSLSAQEFAIPAAPSMGPLSLELTAHGWYTTLGWERWVQTGMGAVDTGTQIYNIVNSSSFVYASTTYIPTTGVTTSQYRPDQNMTGLQEVERLTSLRNSTGGNLWFQVWNDRIGQLVTWAGGDFPAIDYYMDKRGIYDSNYAQLPLWKIRADRVLQTPQFQPLGYGLFTDPLDTPLSMYLLETEMAVGPDDVVLSVKPMGWRDFAQLLRSAA